MGKITPNTLFIILTQLKEKLRFSKNWLFSRKKWWDVSEPAICELRSPAMFKNGGAHSPLFLAESQKKGKFREF